MKTIARIIIEAQTPQDLIDMPKVFLPLQEQVGQLKALGLLPVDELWYLMDGSRVEEPVQEVTVPPPPDASPTPTA